MAATKCFHLATASCNERTVPFWWEEGAGLIQWKKLLCKFPLWTHVLLFLSICNAPIKSKLQHPPPPRANPGHLTIFCARGVGNLTDKAFPGVGNLTLPGWGGENWTGSVRSQTFFLFFFRAPKSLTAINTCLDEMEGLEGRDIAFLSDWITKKGLQKWECLNINDFYRLYINDVDFLYNESSCGFVRHFCLQRFFE